MSAEMYSALVTSRLRPIEGVEVQGGKGLQLKLRVRGTDTTAQLERYYDRYRVNPNDLSDSIDQFIEGLLTGTSDASLGNHAFEDVRRQLLPRLMTSQQWMVRRDDGLRLVIRSIVQDLGAALVLDEGDAFEYVQLDSIPAWEIDSQTAYDAATENLERESRNVQTSVNGAGVQTLLVQSFPHAASQILLPSRLADWQTRVEGDLVLGMPAHDLLLGFSRDHPALSDLRAQIAEDAQNAPNGLFPHLLIVRQGGLELLP